MARAYWLAIKQYRTGWLKFKFEYREHRNKMLEAISADMAGPECCNEIRTYDVEEDD